MKTGDKTTTYQYDKNGNRTASGEGDAKLNYIYDTENRLLAVKDKEGLLFAALYDGDHNRVFTASRTQATHHYQLFKRKPADKKRKSPYTASSGKEHSLFWYGFTQNVIQFFSSFATSEGYDWIATFDTVSNAYHQKVAKDRASKEGLVVHPPSADHLPGESPVVYSSEVQEVLIPYTTKKDTYHYYETRNYVNDVNRQHTQVLQTYDAQLKKRETYTYGRERSNYRNESTGKSYFYLTNQSGSVTGLTEHGEAVASSSYGLYGATKQTTDQTGQPFAYNGEARDVTGLDYLRARYYDSQTGTFLTADSYQGSRTDPLSHNLYTYVQNNPANYTDPSGRYGSPFAMMEGGRGRPVGGYSQPKPLMNPTDGTLYAPSTPEHRAHQVRQQQTQIYSYNYTPSPNAPRTSYQQTLWQQAQAQRSISNAWEQAKAIGQSVYDWGASRTREATNIARNWTKSLEETITHVCTTAERWVEAGVNFLRNVDWKNILKTAAGVAGEFFYVNDLHRVVTGTDPVSGEEANRLEAAAWLAVDIISAGSSKLGKVATVATKADDLFDIVRSSKFVAQANKTLDGAKTFVKSNVDKLLDTSFQLGPKLVPAGGSSVGGTTLREVGQNVKKSLDNLVNYFKKNGDEVGKRTEKGTKGTKAVGNMSEFLDSDFGQELRDSLQKTSKRYDGQRVYKVIENIGNLKKGDQIYLDGLHKDHLEVFNKSGKVKSVLNLDGSINFEKTRKVLEQGRRLP